MRLFNLMLISNETKRWWIHGKNMCFWGACWDSCGSLRGHGGHRSKTEFPPPPQVNRLLLLLRPAGDVWTFSCRLPLNSHFSLTKCSLTPSSSSGTSSSPSCPHSLWVMWLWRSISLDLPGKRKNYNMFALIHIPRCGTNLILYMFYLAWAWHDSILFPIQT